MRFPSRQLGIFSTRQSAASLPLSTLLLAALCVLLVAPATQADAQLKSTRVAILTNAIAASASSCHSQFSALDSRKVKVLLSRLKRGDTELSLAQLEREIAALETGVANISFASPPLSNNRLKPSFITLLSAHEAAHLSGVRTNSYLE